MSQLVDSACFYRSGSCKIEPNKANIVARTSTQINKAEGLISQTNFGPPT